MSLRFDRYFGTSIQWDIPEVGNVFWNARDAAAHRPKIDSLCQLGNITSDMGGLYKSCDGMASVCRMLRAFPRALIGMVNRNVAGKASTVSDLLLEAARSTCAIGMVSLVPVRESISAIAVNILAPHLQQNPVSTVLVRINPNTLTATILDPGNRFLVDRDGSIGLNPVCSRQTPNVSRLRHE